jgi:hypothetical protein
VELSNTEKLEGAITGLAVVPLKIGGQVRAGLFASMLPERYK